MKGEAPEVGHVAGVRDRLVARVQELHATGGDIAAERRSLDSEARRLRTSIENIGLAIERGARTLETLAERLADRERDLRLVRSRLEELPSRESQWADPGGALPAFRQRQGPALGISKPLADFAARLAASMAAHGLADRS